MKRMLMAGVAAMAVLATVDAKALTLEEANERLAEAAEQPATMAEIMKSLSAEDQVAYLASVNEAIAKTPVGAEEKAALYVSANRTAMLSAQKGNLRNLLAEMFATASLESLTVINEDFAKDIFSRTADPTKPVSDEQMKSDAMAAMKAVIERADKADHATERKVFAALMFLRVAGKTPADLRETLLAEIKVPEAEKKEIAETWVPNALGEAGKASYEAMLPLSSEAVPEAGAIRILVSPLALTGTTLIGELGSKDGAGYAPLQTALLDPTQWALPEDAMDFGMTRIPRTLNRDNKWYNGDHRGPGHHDEDDEHHDEPVPYNGQQY